MSAVLGFLEGLGVSGWFQAGKTSTSVIILVALVGAVAAIYGSAVGFDLFADDFNFYGDRPLMRSFVDYFFRGNRPMLPASLSPYYRPTSDFVWVLYAKLFEDRIGLYHLMAILVHLANIGLVYLGARRLLGLNALYALAGAFLFAVAWFSYEPVAWLCTNIFAICTLFYLGTVLGFWEFLRRGRPAFLILAACCGIAALTAYEFAVTIPLASILVIKVCGTKATTRRRIVSVMLVSLALLGGYIWVREALGIGTGLHRAAFTNVTVRLLENAEGTSCAPESWQIASRVLHNTWTYSATLWGDPESRILAILGIVFFVLVILSPKTRWVGLWVPVALLPVAAHHPLPQFAYLAGAGLGWLVALVFSELASPPRQRIIVAQAVVLAILASSTTIISLMNGTVLTRLVLALGLLSLFALTAVVACWDRTTKEGAATAHVGLGWPALARVTIILLIIVHFSLAIDYPSPCRESKGRLLAVELAAVLPKSEKRLVVYTLNERFEIGSTSVGYLGVHGFFALLTGRDLTMALFRDFFLGREWLDEPDWKHTYVIERSGGVFRLRSDIKLALQKKMAGYKAAPPAELTLSPSNAPQPGGPQLITSEGGPDGVRIELGEQMLDPILYDRVRVWLHQAVDRPCDSAVLMWFGPDSEETPLGRQQLGLSGEQLSFNLRAEPGWLTASSIRTLRLYLGSDSCRASLARISIDREPFVHAPRDFSPGVFIDVEGLRKRGALKETPLKNN